MLYHLFELRIDGMDISNEISFSEISEVLRNIRMAPSPDGRILIKVSKRRTRPISISIDEAISEANELADRLILLDNHVVTDLIYLGYENGTFTESKKDVTAKLNKLSFRIGKLLDYYKRPENIKQFNKKDNLGVLRTYRIALGISDKVSQYLIFYGILLVLKGESQKRVDAHILQEIKDIQMVHGKIRKETIITRIRNMIAHPSEQFDITEVNRQVEKYLDTLKVLTLNSLKQ